MSATPRRRRNWRRILLRLLIVLVALRLLLALMLSWLIHLGAGAAGLDATIGESSLTLLGGHVRLEAVELRPRAAAPDRGASSDVITLGAVDADLDMLALLGGTLRLVDVSVDDASIALSRGADGRWPLLDALSGGPTAPAPERAETAASAPHAPPDFRPPVEIDHLALQPMRLRVEDDTASPPRVTSLEGSLRLTNLRGDGREARLELRLEGRDTLDLLRVDGTLAAERETAHATLRLDLAGLRPQGLAALLAAAGLRAAATRLDAGLELSLDARVESGAPVVALDLQQLRVLADGEEALALDALSLGPQAVQAHGLRAALVARTDGALSVAGLDVLPGPPGAPAATPEPAPASSASD
ncbi:MAG TPA: DUF748 domain-containing protein, partial [Planctomycetota bacterium]|nr:DUF748 domain-containing protein [Planctomycetota bacterium]